MLTLDLLCLHLITNWNDGYPQIKDIYHNHLNRTIKNNVEITMINFLIYIYLDF